MITISIIVFFVLLGFSAFFSAAETAIFSLSPLKLNRLRQRYLQVKSIDALLSQPTRLLSTINFGNMLVNVGISSLVTMVFVSFLGNQGLILAILVSGIAILFFGDIFPKTIAIYLAEKVSLFCAPTLAVVAVIFLPFVVVIEKIVEFFSDFIIRLPKRPTGYGELKTAIVLSSKDGQISPQEAETISYVLEFKDTWTSQIMCHRMDINGIDSSLRQKDVLDYLRKQKHSKFPVYQGSLDNTIGIIYAKDVFLNPDKDYHSLMKPVFFIPENKKIDELLKLFLEKNERVAIVLDEYGGTEGLVTLEDIEEEIFGEIYDEFETPREHIEKIAPKTYRISGRAPIKIVNLDLNLELPEEQDTVAGFLLVLTGKIPQAQEKILFKNLEFIVEKATAKRIISVVLKIK
jgi:putative hemolysin